MTWFSGGDRWRISRHQQFIKKGLNQIDCKLTTKEGGVVKYYRAIS